MAVPRLSQEAATASSTPESSTPAAGAAADTCLLPPNACFGIPYQACYYDGVWNCYYPNTCDAGADASPQDAGPALFACRRYGVHDPHC